MQTPTALTLVVATFGTRKVLETNLLASPCLQRPHPHQVLVQSDYRSASKAYNEAIPAACHDLIVFVHQDLILPHHWAADVAQAVTYLDFHDPKWGVLGCYGKTRDGTGKGYLYSPGPGIIGEPLRTPTLVQTLDEIVLIVRRSSGLRFDEDLPHFHMYGADICLRSASMGRNSYVIPAFCVHNADHYLVVPREFYTCCTHVKRRWKDSLPIETTCVRLTRWSVPIYRRRLQELYLRLSGRTVLGRRVESPVPGLLDAAIVAAGPGIVSEL